MAEKSNSNGKKNKPEEQKNFNVNEGGEGNSDFQSEKSTESEQNESFLNKIYNQVSSVIGGENPNQYFCMMLPGTLIDARDYQYDIKGDKPPHVKANESKLVNKMFDACFVTAADNGRHMQSQYKTALNMLSPKLNRELFELKIRLREILMTPYPYDFGNGIENTMSLEQVFYRLYNDYVTTKEAWNQKQVDKKAELKRAIIDPVERNDAYLEWYGLVAEAESVVLEEKLGKVLNVFSPGDMNIINAILNCGVGGEIESARNTMEMVEELNPDGGYVYPVNLYPRNWFELLDSSFSGVDLLESPAALTQKLHLLNMQRDNIMLNISRLTSALPNEEEIQVLRKNYLESEEKFKKLQKTCTDKGLNVTADTIKSIVSICTSGKNNELEGPSEEEASRFECKDNNNGNAINTLISIIQQSGKEFFDSQSKAIEAAATSVVAAIEWCSEQNKDQLKNLLNPLKMQLDSVNRDIAELKEEITISKSVLSNDTTNKIADVLPNKKTDGYTQVIIQSKASSVHSSSSKEISSSTKGKGISFLFGGYSKNKSHVESVERHFDSSSDMDIQIGMNVAKVQIEREWFDPGVFQLTESMYNFSNSKIAPDCNTSFVDDDIEKIKQRFAAMNECIFPSYPVAFVVAKDVSIKFTSASSISSSFAKSMEEHSSRGGGFFIFSGSQASSSSSGQSTSIANSNSNSVTVRFTEPQILGYYMEATPADKSVHINSTSDTDMSIIGFVSKFKQMIEESNRSRRNEKVSG